MPRSPGRNLPVGNYGAEMHRCDGTGTGTGSAGRYSSRGSAQTGNRPTPAPELDRTGNGSWTRRHRRSTLRAWPRATPTGPGERAAPPRLRPAWESPADTPSWASARPTWTSQSTRRNQSSPRYQRKSLLAFREPGRNSSLELQLHFQLRVLFAEPGQLGAAASRMDQDR